MIVNTGAHEVLRDLLPEQFPNERFEAFLQVSGGLVRATIESEPEHGVYWANLGTEQTPYSDGSSHLIFHANQVYNGDVIVIRH